MFIKDVSRPGPYRTLHVDPVERHFWRERFLGMDAGPWVGLCWRSGVGGAGRSQQYSRAEDVVRALGAGTANYVSLVYDLQPEELDAARKLDGCVIYDPENIDQKNEMDRVAALLSALDAVVSVSTAIAPLSASVGTPTILLAWSHLRLSDGHDAILGPLAQCWINWSVSISTYPCSAREGHCRIFSDLPYPANKVRIELQRLPDRSF